MVMNDPDQYHCYGSVAALTLFGFLPIGALGQQKGSGQQEWGGGGEKMRGWQRAAPLLGILGTLPLRLSHHNNT